MNGGGLILSSGNSYKSMFVSVEASLKKLQTSYIDVLCEPQRRDGPLTADLHWWDWTTPIEEVMQGLNTLVRQGKG